jgi:dipeptidyl aminopeptidase/acylaminoacyl peptidase
LDGRIISALLIWAAAVEPYGIINWSTMLKSSDPSLNEYLKALLGNPEENRKIYEANSPITYIRSEKASLLVLEGDNDPRAPKKEAQQVVDILKKEGTLKIGLVDFHSWR